jgi:transcriptional regulator of acetoin/glycerol metabolism
MKPAWKDVVLHKRETRSQIRDVILESWRLCLKNKLDPRNPQRPPALNNQQLFTLRTANRDLIQIANPVMKMIEISVKGTGFMVTLSEKQGIVLAVPGDKEILGMAQTTHYLPGCNRST